MPPLTDRSPQRIISENGLVGRKRNCILLPKGKQKPILPPTLSCAVIRFSCLVERPGDSCQCIPLISHRTCFLFSLSRFPSRAGSGR